MAGSKRTKLHSVTGKPEKSGGLEEVREKIRLHRIKLIVLVLGIASIAILAVNIFIYYFQHMTYKSYDVIQRMEREDTEASEFNEFQGRLLKYTKDGVVYSAYDGEVLWNQSYEMENPHISICDQYLAVYDQGGTDLYVLNKEGLRYNIKSTVPIQRVSISAKGSIAVLTEDDGTSYLRVYDNTGDEAAAGQLHIEDGGFPLDIAISQDGQKLAVARLDINEGNVKSTVVFYNYGSVGQNEIDNIVGVYSYSDMVIPEIHYISNDRMLAFGDTEVIVYEGAQKPTVTQELDLDQEVLSVFYKADKYGLVFNGTKSNTYLMRLYNLKGVLLKEIEFRMDYKKIQFLENGMICIRNDKRCMLYNVNGAKRFDHTFNKDIYDILSEKKDNGNYIFILNGETIRVKLTR